MISSMFISPIAELRRWTIYPKMISHMIANLLFWRIVQSLAFVYKVFALD